MRSCCSSSGTSSPTSSSTTSCTGGKLAQGDRRHAADVVHGGHGELHGQGRRAARQDVPARRGGQRHHPVDYAGSTSAASSPTASVMRCSTSSRSAGARKASATSSTSIRNTLGGRVGPRGRARLPDRRPRTSTSSSAAGCARSTCRSWSRTGEPGDFGRPFRAERAGDEPRGSDLAGGLAVGRSGGGVQHATAATSTSCSSTPGSGA